MQALPLWDDDAQFNRIMQTIQHTLVDRTRCYMLYQMARQTARTAGEVAEVGTHLLRSAVLAGILNAVLDEKVNVVNAPAIATARGLKVEEETRKREHGFPNTLEISVLPQSGASQEGFSAEGTVLFDGSPRILQIEGIALEAQRVT